MNRTTTEMNRTNPFHRDSRSNGSRHNNNRTHGYNDWKNKTVAEPKQRVLGPEDFPSLAPTTVKEKGKTVWQTSDTTLAESVKDHLENDTVPTKKVEHLVEDFYVLPLDPKKEKRVLYKEKVDEEIPPFLSPGPYILKKKLREKYRDILKKREIEAEEAAYRWQMSKRMIPPMPEPPMRYLEEEDEEEDEDIQAVYQEEQKTGRRQDW